MWKSKRDGRKEEEEEGRKKNPVFKLTPYDGWHKIFIVVKSTPVDVYCNKSVLNRVGILRGLKAHSHPCENYTGLTIYIIHIGQLI